MLITPQEADSDNHQQQSEAGKIKEQCGHV